MPHVSAKQFVLSVPVTDAYSESSSTAICWLEAGGVGFGPVVVDAALALPNAEQLQFQRSFIALHDKRTRRLHFLWNSDNNARCGCLGGCTFFGENRNGPTVFQPSEQDFAEGINAAVVHICSDGNSIGFGQSLLRPGETVFKMNHRRERHLPRRPSSNSKQSAYGKYSVESRRDAAEVKSSSAYIPLEGKESGDHRQPAAKLTVVNERDAEHTAAAFAVPLTPPPRSNIQKLPLSSARTADVNLASSVSSLSDSGLAQRRSLGHGRTYSYEPPKTFAAVATTPDAAFVSTPTKRDRIESHSSLISSTGGSHSRRSSLASPVLRRLSSQVSVHDEDDMTQAGSLASIVSSDNFFSANENAASSVASMTSMPVSTVMSTIPSSPTSNSITVSSVYDLALESPTMMEKTDSVTDVESYVSAQEDHPDPVPDRIESPSVHDTSDEDMETFAADDDAAEESFDTDATQVKYL